MRTTLLTLLTLLVCSSASAQSELHAPRIMYWWGKVNQHVDVASGAWVSDPDGVSGADLDMLGYCRRWYPETVAVRPFDSETISTWRERGGVGAHTATQISYECVQPFVPRGMPWWRKVDQHVDPITNTWREAGGVGAHTATRVSYWCAP